MRILLALTLAAAAALPAQAQTVNNCADRAKITERLTSGYGEKFAGGGLRNADSIFEVWMSDDSGTWTILMTRPDGTACVMAAGTDWRVALPGAPEGIPG